MQKILLPATGSLANDIAVGREILETCRRMASEMLAQAEENSLEMSRQASVNLEIEISKQRTEKFIELQRWEDSYKKDFLYRWNDTIKCAVMTIVKQIVGYEVARPEFSIRPILCRTLNETSPDNTPLAIQVNPSQVVAATEAVMDAKHPETEHAKIAIEGDPSLTNSSARIICQDSVIELSVEAHTERLSPTQLPMLR